MGGILVIVGGVACGVVAAAPLLLLLGRSDDDLGRGFGAVLFSFVFLQAALFVVSALWPGLLVSFGVLATLSFLMCSTLAVVAKAFRD